jgi:hypothetical protein
MTPLDRAREIIELRAKATQGWLVADTNIYGTGKYVCCERGAIPIGDRVAEVLESHAGLDSNQGMANAIFFAHAANHAAEVAQALIEAQAENARLRAALVAARHEVDDRVPAFRNDKVLAAIDAALEESR